MKFARKPIHWGPVHHCHEPVEVLQWPWFYLNAFWTLKALSDGTLKQKKKK